MRVKRRILTAVFAATAASAMLTSCGSQLTPEEAAAALGHRGGAIDQDIPASGSGRVETAPTDAVAAGPTATAAPGSDSPTVKPGAKPNSEVPLAKTACKPGTATATGLSPNTLKIANASDISGPIPGFAESAQQAVKAFVAFQNATRGGICGRKLELMSFDSRTSSSGDQEAALRACEQSFALVGSFSAFDDGGAKPSAECGIPDLRLGAVTKTRADSPVTFATSAQKLNLVPAAIPDYFKSRFPTGVKSAAYLYLNAPAAVAIAVNDMKAYEKRGYHWAYTQAIDVTDFNYSPYVVQMKQRGVKVVHFQGGHPQAVRLAKAMEQQGFKPEAFVVSAAEGYKREYIESGGPAVQGTFIAGNTALFEEMSSNPELKLYTSWLQKTVPGAEPTYYGMYAWSAGRLFAQLAEKLGPRLSRKAILAALRGVSGWAGHGIHAPQQVGAKRTSPCVLFTQLKGSKYVRQSPAKGWTCGSLVDTGTGG